MATDKNTIPETNDQPIRTLAFEYALSRNYQCKVCRKSILRKTLCINTIERANKKQKKKSSVCLDSCHFKCWIVPGEFKRKPLEVFRGYSALKDSDKSKIQRLYEAGPGSSWPALLAADEEERLAAEEAEAEAAEAQQGEEDFTKKPVQIKQSKPTKRKAANDDDDHDMTKALTGAQVPTQAAANDDNKKVATANKKSKKNVSKSTPTKKEKEAKKKETPKPVIKLDDVHGEGFTQDFTKLLEDFKQ